MGFLDRMAISPAQVIRVIGLSCALLCVGVAIGNAITIARGNAELQLAWTYPVMFVLSAAVWILVAHRPTPSRCSFASSLCTVPAVARSVDFAATWILDGAERPGVQVVAISGWGLVAVLSVSLAITVGMLSHREMQV